MSQLADPSTVFISKHKNLYVSQCNVCGQGVFQNQAWVFSRRPLGIVHTDCVGAR